MDFIFQLSKDLDEKGNRHGNIGRGGLLRGHAIPLNVSGHY